MGDSATILIGGFYAGSAVLRPMGGKRKAVWGLLLVLLGQIISFSVAVSSFASSSGGGRVKIKVWRSWTDEAN